MLRHCTIYLFESHYNTLRHSFGIYRGYFFVGVYRWIQEWKIMSVKVIAIYRQSFFIGVFVYICLFSDGVILKKKKNVLHNEYLMSSEIICIGVGISKVGTSFFKQKENLAELLLV